ncbi:hypothetical protein SAMN05444483_101457 [Salegentibacter echinorum]|uniref:Adhesin n=1 Tax=Salegentibacter echinorum TaxID=1073325 RepID=A0A1M5CCP5_SALEC|nr:hypothetical protein [Salegentibacter echinorum]SHF52489.1 hypothetical protein SAMN05444483_101457 [Salegentibacter echinorum]
MKIIYKLFLIFFLLPALSHGNGDFKGRYTKEKKVTKSYKVSANDLLTIDNSYGNIDISTWNQNKIMIQVIIKTNGNDEEKVQRKLDEINIRFEQNPNSIMAKTRFTREDRSWWDNLFGSSNNVNMEVNYTIKAPEKHNLEIENDYGGIYIDKILGNTKISCDYGKIDVGELWGNENILNFDYTRNSHIGFVKNAEINADYSGFEIEEAEKLYVNADYTDSKIKKVADLDFNADYGSITIEKAKRIVGNGDYLSTKIGRVFESLDLNLDYGSASIDKILKSTKKVEINTDYAGVKIGYDAEFAFTFTIKTAYGSVKGLDNFEINKRHDKNNSKLFEGYHLDANSGKTIYINTSYGNINFNKN